jgi:hypothetical protein
MAVQIPQFYAIFPGNTAPFKVTVTASDNVTPFNLTSSTVNWTGKLWPESAATLFAKSIGADVVIAAPLTGVIQLWLRPLDTGTLNAGQTIYNYVTVTDTLGNVYTVEEFQIFLRN